MKLKCISSLTNGVQKDFFWYPTSLFNFLTLPIQVLTANVKEKSNKDCLILAGFCFSNHPDSC